MIHINISVFALLGTAGIAIGITSTALAQDVAPFSSIKFQKSGCFEQIKGDALYRAICQGCHMQAGKGASGVVDFPRLIDSAYLKSGPSLVAMILNGMRGMPGFGLKLNDDQVVAVASYAREISGRKYMDQITTELVNEFRKKTGKCAKPSPSG
jgi:mono/diheme cytochrome c family protein